MATSQSEKNLERLPIAQMAGIVASMLNVEGYSCEEVIHIAVIIAAVEAKTMGIPKEKVAENLINTYNKVSDETIDLNRKILQGMVTPDKSNKVH